MLRLTHPPLITVLDHMQRPQSVVASTNLLNPAAQADHNNSRSQQTDATFASASVTLIKSNEPLPSAQVSETTNELPRPYKCPLCGMAFHRLEHATRHIRIHTREKPYSCRFHGCTKRFSRSDELTRHSRIHNSSNSRRGCKGRRHQHQHHLRHGLPPHLHCKDIIAPPTAPKLMFRSASTSTLAPSNILTPRSFASFAQHPHPRPMHSNRGGDIPMLAKATSPVDRETLAVSLRHGARPYYNDMHGSRGHSNGLSAYHMARPHSIDGHDDHYNGMCQAKHSRPNSPNSTAPPSPTLSYASLSSTPGYAPIATPAHSPRLPPFSSHELPSIQKLSLQHNTPPGLAPMEPHIHAPKFPPQLNAPGGNGLCLTDIISCPDGTQRKIPNHQVRKIAVQDLLLPDNACVDWKSQSVV